MTIKELAELIQAEDLTPDAAAERAVTCGYACDLLSWVMAHGKPGMAWITVQTHMNVIAVASLSEMAAVIIPEKIAAEAPTLEKAKEEGIHVLSSALNAYEICAALAAAGLPGKTTED